MYSEVSRSNMSPRDQFKQVRRQLLIQHGELARIILSCYQNNLEFIIGKDIVIFFQTVAQFLVFLLSHELIQVIALMCNSTPFPESISVGGSNNV